MSKLAVSLVAVILAASVLSAAAAAASDELASVYEDEHPVALIEATMFTPGSAEPDTSFEDALLSAPEFAHPQWRWLQRETGALRNNIVSEISESESTDDVDEAIAAAKAKKSSKGVWSPKADVLFRAYKRIHSMFKAAEAHYVEGQRMKNWHLNALKACRERLYRMKAKYHRLRHAMDELNRAEQRARKTDAARLKILHEQITQQKKHLLVHNAAAVAAETTITSLKFRILDTENKIRDLVRHILRVQRHREHAGLPAMTAAQRRDLRSWVRLEIAAENKKLDAEIDRARDGKYPIPSDELLKATEAAEKLKAKAAADAAAANAKMAAAAVPPPPQLSANVPPAAVSSSSSAIPTSSSSTPTTSTTTAPAPAPAPSSSSSSAPTSSSSSSSAPPAPAPAPVASRSSSSAPTTSSSSAPATAKTATPTIGTNTPTVRSSSSSSTPAAKPTTKPAMVISSRSNAPVFHNPVPVTRRKAQNSRDKPLSNCVKVAGGPSGRYWLKDGNGHVYLGFCLNRYAGGGWTLVTEKGHKAYNPNDVVPDKSGSTNVHKYNLRGRQYHEVLVRRTSPYWCDSFGKTQATHWGAHLHHHSASMGISVDGRSFNYPSKYHHGRVVRQSIRLLKHWSSFRRHHRHFPWQVGRLERTQVHFRRASRSGSVVRIIARSHHNHKLEIANLNSILKSFGGCSVDGQSTFQVYIRPYDPAHHDRVYLRHRLSALRRAGSNVDVCCGSTHAADWKNYWNHMYVDVSMRKCGFVSTPEVFSSQSGISSHWTDTGANAHYGLNRHSFRVYTTSLYKWRNRFHYKIHWCAFGKKDKRARHHERKLRRHNRGPSTCCGEAPASGWKVYSPQGHIWQDIDMSKCNFVHTPQVFTSLGGTSSHWVLKGVSATYFNNPRGFRSYLYGTNVAIARQYNYRLSWCATGIAKHTYTHGVRVIDRFNRVRTQRGRMCCGQTRPTWHNYYSRGIYADINTSKCNFSKKVRYFGALSGNSNHWKTTGADAIYFPRDRSFRTYIYSHDWVIRVPDAARFGYVYNWCGVDY